MDNLPLDHLPDDEFMKASAEEWSKPEPVSPLPPRPESPTNRWGAPIQPKNIDDGNRWGAEKLDNSDSPKIKDLFPKTDKSGKKKFPWWVILLIILGVICLCGTLVTLILVLIF